MAVGTDSKSGWRCVRVSQDLQSQEHLHSPYRRNLKFAPWNRVKRKNIGVGIEIIKSYNFQCCSINSRYMCDYLNRL